MFPLLHRSNILYGLIPKDAAIDVVPDTLRELDELAKTAPVWECAKLLMDYTEHLATIHCKPGVVWQLVKPELGSNCREWITQLIEEISFWAEKVVHQPRRQQEPRDEQPLVPIPPLKMHPSGRGRRRARLQRIRDKQSF